MVAHQWVSNQWEWVVLLLNMVTQWVYNLLHMLNLGNQDMDSLSSKWYSLNMDSNNKCHKDSNKFLKAKTLASALQTVLTREHQLKLYVNTATTKSPQSVKLAYLINK